MLWGHRLACPAIGLHTEKEIEKNAKTTEFYKM
jgi:hypothetical protein